MAVRAAEGSAGGFSGSRSILLKRAKAPNTASQKDEAIQANRMANSDQDDPTSRDGEAVESATRPPSG